MSEYWVSKKRYFCRYCDIYIAEDAPSRQHHENGMRHKGNVDRFVRGLYKAGEKKKKDTEEEKREMVRIEQAAQAAFAQDVGAGRAKGAPVPVLTTAVASSSKKPPAKSRGGFADYSTAESLGYIDPDVERALAEAAARQTEAVIGEWHYVQSTPGQASHSATPEVKTDEGGAEALTVGADEASRKRLAEDVDEEDGRGWKLRRKEVNVGLGEIYDPGVIPIKLKPKKEEIKEDLEASVRVAGVLGAEASGLGTGTADGAARPVASSVPKWTSTKWKRAGEGASAEDSGSPALGDGSATPAGDAPTAPVLQVKPEDEDNTTQTDPAVKQELLPVKSEPADLSTLLPTETPSGGALFRKRKAPVAGTIGRGRRF